MRVTLPNGIVLDDSELGAPTLNQGIPRRGLDGVRVFVATDPDGSQCYLIVEGQTPIYESQQFEAIACHLDIMKMDRDYCNCQRDD